MTLAERVRAAMAEKGCTLTELATAVGVKPPSVSGWITGETRSLKADSALKASRFLGVEVAWLAAGILPMRANEQEHVAGTESQIESNPTTDDQAQQNEEIDIPPALDPEDEPVGLRAVEKRTVARPPMTEEEYDLLDGYRLADEEDQKRMLGLALIAKRRKGSRRGEKEKQA